MPPETQIPPSSISQPLGKHSRNWKKTGLILLILGISVSLIGVGIYFIGTGDFQAPSSQKQATLSSKKSKRPPLVFAFSRETEADEKLNEDVVGYEIPRDIWLYESGKTKQLTKTDGLTGKYQLSKDNKSLYYIKKDAIGTVGSDYFFGIELIERNLATGEEKVLVPKIKLDKEVLKGVLLDFDVSHDGKNIVFTQNGLWVLDLTSNKTTRLAESTYYSQEGGEGHSYKDVYWSPSDKYIASSWTGYERLGYELINVNTKKITSIEPGGFGPTYNFSDFLDDNKGIFINNNSFKEQIISKDFDDLKKEVLFKGFVIDWEEGPFTDFFGLKYVASEDRIYMIQKITTLNKPKGTGSYFHNKIIYLDRKTGKMSDLTKEFGKDVIVSNLAITSGGKYILFNVGEDVWLYEAEKKTSRLVVNGAFNPIFPGSK